MAVPAIIETTNAHVRARCMLTLWSTPKSAEVPEAAFFTFCAAGSGSVLQSSDGEAVREVRIH
jgi:hypothetical protein